jgi:putative heme-binding domain-containing protein
MNTLPKPVGPGKSWSLGELANLTREGFKGRNFENGKRSFSSARCIVCHRFNGEGGATGPDLSQVAGRFSAKDLSESIVDPNKVVSDQYRASVVETHSGKLITGKIVSETSGNLLVLTDPEDSTKVVDLKKSDVADVKLSPVSLMPAKLIDSLNQEEVLDLLAYMLSKGDSKSPYFSK